MNKKQLIVAWVTVALINISFLHCIGFFAGSGFEIDIYAEWLRSWLAYTLVILINGSLLIYTLRDKKK